MRKLSLNSTWHCTPFVYANWRQRRYKGSVGCFGPRKRNSGIVWIVFGAARGCKFTAVRSQHPREVLPRLPPPTSTLTIGLLSVPSSSSSSLCRIYCTKLFSDNISASQISKNFPYINKKRSLNHSSFVGTRHAEETNGRLLKRLRALQTNTVFLCINYSPHHP